jgi:hypothetical protein
VPGNDVKFSLDFFVGLVAEVPVARKEFIIDEIS